MKLSKFTLLLLLSVTVFFSIDAQTITTVVGCGFGDDSIATKAELFMPVSTAIDPMGNIYISDALNYRIRKIKVPSGLISTVAGIGLYQNSGDGGMASAAGIIPRRIVFDKIGNLIIAENLSIRKISATGIISTIAGTGVSGFSGDNGSATLATFAGISDIAVDTFGNIYVADFMNDRVRKINTLGIVTTVAGSGSVGYSGDGVAATAASLNRPFSVATDNAGNFYFGEYNNHRIRKVGSTGLLTTVAGNGTRGYTGDGGPATVAEMTAPVAIILDSAGNLYFSDNHNYCIRKVDITGTITTIAGKGISGYGGDGGLADSAEMSTPNALDIDKFGNIYVADAWNNRIREITTAGIITTIAGQNCLFDDGIPATSAEISIINNMATDTLGRLYFADTYNNRIRRLDPTTGIVTTVAGAGISGYGDGFSGDGGQADSAHIYYPGAVATDNNGNMYIADVNNNRIRKVTPGGIINTVAGKGVPGFGGDGGLADSAMLYSPNNVTVDGNGNIFIGDNGNYRIRKVNTAGIISTLAGTGVLGFGGDGGPASAATLGVINDLFADNYGNIFIADAQNNRIRKIDTFGNINTVAGNGATGFSGDGGPATNASLSAPCGIKVDNNGVMYIADFNNGRVRKVDVLGNISTIAGNGGTGFSGDGGPALSATFSGPAQLAIGTNGDIYISDDRNFRIRKITGTMSVPADRNTDDWNISVYPNPVADKIILSVISTVPKNGKVVIFDMSSKQVFNMTLNATYEAIDLNYLPAGCYLLQVTTDEGGSKQLKLEKE